MISTKYKIYKKSAKGRRENIWLSVMIHGPRCARSLSQTLSRPPLPPLLSPSPASLPLNASPSPIQSMNR